MKVVELKKLCKEKKIKGYSKLKKKELIEMLIKIDEKDNSIKMKNKLDEISDIFVSLIDNSINGVKNHINTIKITDLKIKLLKICDFKLNRNISKSLIGAKFNIDNKIKKIKKNAVYFITIDSYIYKIGKTCMEVKNVAGYCVGNGGSPSLRTTGIHYYIADQLKKNRQVEMYYYICEEIDVVIPNLDGTNSICKVSLSNDYYEKRFIENYKEMNNGFLPPWNMQEGGRKKDWPIYIKEINNFLRSKKENKKIEYKKILNKYKIIKNNKIQFFLNSYKEYL